MYCPNFCHSSVLTNISSMSDSNWFTVNCEQLYNFHILLGVGPAVSVWMVCSQHHNDNE